MIVLAGIVIAGKAAGLDTNNNVSLPGSESQRATDLLSDGLPGQANGTNPIVLEAPSGKLTDAANEKVVKRTVASLQSAPGVRSAVSPLSQQGAGALSKDGRIGYVSVSLDEGPSGLTKEDAEDVLDAAEPADRAGFTVGAGGYLGNELSKPGEGPSEAIGLGAAVVILLFAFGTAVAMAMPIATAVTGLASGLSLVALLTHVVEVPNVGPTLGTMIGLGVGIDYALFVVTRHRASLAAGNPVRESVVTALGTAGSAVLFAGTTVIIALLSLVLAHIPIVSALGYTAAIMVAIAIAAALTLLPALLGLVRERIDSLRVPLGRHSQSHEEQAHGWTRWAERVAARPLPAIAVAVALLLLLAAPVLNLRLGQQDNGELPKSTTARVSYDLLTTGFGAGYNGPLLVAVNVAPPAKPDKAKLHKLQAQQQAQQQAAEQSQQQAVANATQQLEGEGVPPDEAQQQAEQQVSSQAPPGPSAKKQKQLADEEAFLRSPASDPRLVSLGKAVSKANGVDSVSPARVSKDGKTALITAVPNSAPSAERTQDVVRDLRDTVIPKALKGTGMTASVGGQTAGNIDLADRITDKLPSVIAIVVALSFVVLMLAFRSIVIPLSAAVMNLLSVGAAYGVVTFVFQEGHGATLLGLDGAVPIVSFVPLLMFAILFGLSMDYQVFLLSQVEEQYAQTNDNRQAVVRGLGASGRVITSAALIMVTVFLSFVLNGDPTVKQFGLGLAVAIAVDALVVRSLLVPAVMVLTGRSNWWLPAWLDRALPRIHVE
jgi:RND superfamily putative drug exporter